MAVSGPPAELLGLRDNSSQIHSLAVNKSARMSACEASRRTAQDTDWSPGDGRWLVSFCDLYP